MRRILVIVLMVALAALNVALLFQNQQLRSETSPNDVTDKDTIPDYLYGSYYEGEMYYMDVRGCYTYPGLGSWFMPRDAEGKMILAPLSLAVFVSAESSCPYRTNEVAVYKRLLPVFKERGQQIFVVANRADSAVIADSLAVWELEVPLILRESNLYSASMTFDQIGIAATNMPFKILYDGSLTAIYMRGANNSPESQRDFEVAVSRLSELVAEGQL